MSLTETREPTPSVPPSRRRARLSLLALLVAFDLAVVVLVARGDGETATGYAFAELGARATTRVVPAAQAQQALDALDGPRLLSVPFAEGSIVVGQITYTMPLGAEGMSLALIVTDAVNHTSTTNAVGSGPTTADGAGRFWDGRLGALATKHSWLSGIGDRGNASIGFTSDQMALRLPASGPLTFLAQVPAGGSSHNGIALTLVLQDEQGEVRWVERLS